MAYLGSPFPSTAELMYIRRVDHLEVQVAALEAERDALRKDAERYRWLLSQSWFQVVFDRFDFDDGGMQKRFEECAAQIIDAAIAAKEPKESEHAHDWRFSLQDHVYKCDCGATRGDYPFGAASFKD